MVHTCPIWVYPVWQHISIYCDVRLSVALGYWSSYSQGQLFEGKISELWGNIKARKGWRKIRNILWISEMMRLYCPVFLSSRPHFTSANWLVVLQCSVTCGIGSRRRAVICSGGRNKCDPKSRPEDISQCNPGACPEWKAGEWSKVGVFQIFWFFFLSHSQHFYSWSKNALIVFMIIILSVLSRAGVDRNNVGSNAADRTSHVIQPRSRHRQRDVNLMHALNGKLGSGAWWVFFKLP